MKKKSPTYQCAECGMTVMVVDGQVIRPCPHKEAGVVANMVAHAVGISSLASNK